MPENVILLPVNKLSIYHNLSVSVLLDDDMQRFGQSNLWAGISIAYNPEDSNDTKTRTQSRYNHVILNYSGV